MIEWTHIQKLMGAFPNSSINQCGEFIAHREAKAKELYDKWYGK